MEAHKIRQPGYSSLDLTIHFNAQRLMGTIMEGLYLDYGTQRDKRQKVTYNFVLTLIFLQFIFILFQVEWLAWLFLNLRIIQNSLYC